VKAYGERLTSRRWYAVGDTHVAHFESRRYRYKFVTFGACTFLPPTVSDHGSLFRNKGRKIPDATGKLRKSKRSHSDRIWIIVTSSSGF
jgi:hypothetical protein